MPLNTGLYANLPDLMALQAQTRGHKLKPQQKVWAQMSGSQHAVQKGRGMEFSEVRHYQPGDDIRNMDWRVTARTQKPHTKVFVEEQERPTVIVMQQTPELFFGSHLRFKNVQVLQVGALFAWLTLHQNDRLGGWVFTDTQHAWTPPKHQHSHVMRLLQQGVHLQQHLTQPGKASPGLWATQLRQLQRHLKPGGQLILIGDLLSFDEVTVQQLHQLHRHQEIIACHIYDRLEKGLPHLGQVKITDGEQELQLDSEDPHWRQHYQHAYETKMFHVKQLLIQQRIPLIEIAADDDPMASLIQQGVVQ